MRVVLIPSASCFLRQRMLGLASPRPLTPLRPNTLLVDFLAWPMMVRVPDLSGALACRVLGDEGNMAIGGYFGRHKKPAGVKAHHRDRRFFRNQRGKHRVVLASQGARPKLRFRKVSIRISQAASFTRARIAKETVLHADEAALMGQRT